HPAQAAALGEIEGALAAGRPRTFLLHGVTGSGKTEVYIRAIRAALAQGKTALVLVPEIALTPQTVRRFRAHFGDRVAVLHSRMSDGERYDAWRAIRDGRYPIVIGPRSAVFAPLENLGLVVVDEEHEASYKQFDPAPRYHARDVAVMRAHRAGAVCVLGSATPSLESLANAKAAKYRLLKMPERVPVRGKQPAPLPPVRVVDLAREKEVRRLKGALSHDLRNAIRARLDRREQVILLQNRRGYAPVLTCDDCGFTPHCRDCAVSLTVHKPRRQLRCHYCGWTERQPDACPKCGSGALALLGAGTQRVEEELAEAFPEARVLRMDLDTTARRGAHRRLLDAFGSGEADVLLGTQMVAKGLDFPRVTLVGVVNADTGMLLPDFRAAERTFQLLAQVAGRAGRRDLPGEVILQTRNPGH
ncbi:MAG TPA: primosomal protein N', partial [Anaeromyxobacteraceae bacterium]|nr:primosomal protein N' [Anaeromyxobacteraceae bacterium]